MDISLDRVYEMRLDTEDPDIDYARLREAKEAEPPSVFVEQNRKEGKRTWVERNPDVRDFYDENDEYTVTNVERNRYRQFLEGLSATDRATLERAVEEDRNYYILEFSNRGGLAMPIILEVEYENGAKEQIRMPAEIWRRSPHELKKLLVTAEKISSFVVDPMLETADADIENNFYPRRMIPSRIESYPDPGREGLAARDLMHDIKTELASEASE